MAAQDIGKLEARLWEAADELRANSPLKSSDYSVPVLGLIFLKYADVRFSQAEKEIEKKTTGRRKIGKTDYQAKGVLYLPGESRFSSLLQLPEGSDIGKAINEAMKAIEKENEELRDVLPKTYNRISSDVLVSLLKIFNSMPENIEGDAFGKIYEYFLGNFAMKEGQKAGEFFTPTSVVKLIVEIIEPFHGRILDPACGSGGMFVQSADFVERHRKRAAEEITVFGCERVDDTIRLCKMNLAVHGLSGDIKQANTYYEDPHKMAGVFDFVMANPPFNVDKVDKEKIKDDRGRYPFGMPRVDNANYLWIQLFFSALNQNGRAGFVMANSAADARASELEIRKQIIESGGVDVVVSLSSNFFYTVTLPVTLWFIDKAKTKLPPCQPSPNSLTPALSQRERESVPKAGEGQTECVRGNNTILFVDARNIYRQIDRAHRDFLPEQIEFLANVVRLYRGERIENDNDSIQLLRQYGFMDGEQQPSPQPSPTGRGKGEGFRYVDIPGLCRVATLGEIEAQGWSLNPGRYVGVADRAEDDFDFKERLEELNEELEKLNKEAHGLEERIADNVEKLLEAE